MFQSSTYRGSNFKFWTRISTYRNLNFDFQILGFIAQLTITWTPTFLTVGSSVQLAVTRVDSGVVDLAWLLNRWVLDLRGCWSRRSCAYVSTLWRKILGAGFTCVRYRSCWFDVVVWGGDLSHSWKLRKILKDRRVKERPKYFSRVYAIVCVSPSVCLPYGYAQMGSEGASWGSKPLNRVPRSDLAISGYLGSYQFMGKWRLGCGIWYLIYT